MSDNGNEININMPNVPESPEAPIEKEPPKPSAKIMHHKTRFYYSFLTLVLILCIIQIGVSTIINISKTISNRTKIRTMEHILDNAEAYNDHLKNEIKLFSTNSTLEGIARNNLKMVGENEVLVIINETKQETPDKDQKDKSKDKDKDKDKSKQENKTESR